MPNFYGKRILTIKKNPENQDSNTEKQKDLKCLFKSIEGGTREYRHLQVLKSFPKSCVPLKEFRCCKIPFYNTCHYAAAKEVSKRQWKQNAWNRFSFSKFEKRDGARLQQAP